MKAFAVFVLVLAGLVPTHADTTQTWNLTASCQSVPDGVSVCTDPANISATLTTQMEFGTYADPSGTGNPEQEIEPQITSLSGTYDGQVISLLSGISSSSPWLDDFVGNFPQMLYFMAGGQTYLLYWDEFAWIVPPNQPNQEALNFTSIDPIPSVPEPSTLALLIGLLSLGLMRWAQMNLRKLSAH